MNYPTKLQSAVAIASASAVLLPTMVLAFSFDATGRTGVKAFNARLDTESSITADVYCRSLKHEDSSKYSRCLERQNFMRSNSHVSSSSTSSSSSQSSVSSSSSTHRGMKNYVHMFAQLSDAERTRLRTYLKTELKNVINTCKEEHEGGSIRRCIRDGRKDIRADFKLKIEAAFEAHMDN